MREIFQINATNWDPSLYEANNGRILDYRDQTQLVVGWRPWYLDLRIKKTNNPPSHSTTLSSNILISCIRQCNQLCWFVLLLFQVCWWVPKGSPDTYKTIGNQGKARCQLDKKTKIPILMYKSRYVPRQLKKKNFV